MQEIIAQTEKLEQLSMQIVKALSGAIDAKDTYTNGHSTRVAEYAREIAKRVGFSKEEQDDIYMMGLLHDIGKIGIPDAIINLGLGGKGMTLITGPAGSGKSTTLACIIDQINQNQEKHILFAKNTIITSIF